MGERGAVTPIAIMISFLLSVVCLHQLSLFMLEKESMQSQHEHFSAQALLTLAERKWWEEVAAVEKESTFTYEFQQGTVEVQHREYSEEEMIVRWVAETKEGAVAQHGYLLQKEAFTTETAEGIKEDKEKEEE
ncbi:hypothetical protein [Salsuginibacillus kocurii]|uniref:hypothetical protein n=1 Tax=Salsuginibacillus kocurii TaxID=427078 RepID=UPI0003A57858|nr:hypothetical protein [Salsuginibacillus kocurii]